MKPGSAINVLVCIAEAPRTTPQVARHCGISTQSTEFVVRGLHKRGLLYVIEEIPPLLGGRAAAVYAMQPGLKPYAVPDCRRWRELPPEERLARRLEHYGAEAIDLASETRQHPRKARP